MKKLNTANTFVSIKEIIQFAVEEKQSLSNYFFRLRPDDEIMQNN